ncbi:DUF4229 domain-containing protein [Corynebacterium epidermidicanis]|uniref:DUF4229 domain-containing protein n=1 Tax=Corynebacterium epidermidicanis TaxID=1050174 RepID=UPI00077518DB|nr:DUF4229 domain-containing protein [Corynebacterium epidermidicanis]
MNEKTNPEPTLDTSLRNRAWRDIALYGLARILLFAVLTVVIAWLAYLIGAPVPLLISAMLALFVAFPLSMFMFKGLRIRVNAELAEWDAQRKAHKEWVRSELAER